MWATKLDLCVIIRAKMIRVGNDQICVIITAGEEGICVIITAMMALQYVD